MKLMRLPADADAATAEGISALRRESMPHFLEKYSKAYSIAIGTCSLEAKNQCYVLYHTLQKMLIVILAAA